VRKCALERKKERGIRSKEGNKRDKSSRRESGKSRVRLMNERE
jgi:hypothetical protein